MQLWNHIFSFLWVISYIPSISISITIVSVLCGREKYLKILHKYLDVLIQQKLVDCVHLWDFTTNKVDKAYILQLSDAKEGYMYMPATRNYTFDLNNANFFNAYYEYYTNEANLGDDDVLIKCDDDVVFIDTQRLPKFLNITIHSKGFVYPNLVNDEIGALIQSKYGVHSLINSTSSSSFIKHETYEDEPSFQELSDGHYMTNWHNDATIAVKIHELFLDSPNRFTVNTTDILLWKQHMSITFFAGRGIVIRRFYQSFLQQNHGQTPQQFFTGTGRKHMDGKANKIVPSFAVVHFGFHLQIPLHCELSLLPRYESLATNISGETF
jgi:hypothetical protein